MNGTRQFHQAPLSHPLLQTAPESMMYWSLWQKCWQEAIYLEQYESLLNLAWHEHMDMEHQEDDRLRFFLLLADRDPDDLFDDPEAPEHLTESRKVNHRRYRWRIGSKAFAVLSRSYFRPAAEDDRRWSGLMPLLPQLLEFFRWDNTTQQLPNLEGGREGKYQEIQYAHQFAGKLARWAWNGRILSDHDLRRHDDGAVAVKLREVRPTLIEILFGLGEIEALLDARRYAFDDRCWARLEQLALLPRPFDAHPHSPITRTPDSLEEALAAGSAAARVLVLRRQIDAELIRQAQAQREKDRQALLARFEPAVEGSLLAQLAIKLEELGLLTDQDLVKLRQVIQAHKEVAAAKEEWDKAQRCEKLLKLLDDELSQR